MTNFNRIRSMAQEEMVAFLSSIRKGRDLPTSGFCSEGNCPQYSECEEFSDGCMCDEDADIRWWLCKEADE